MTGPKHYLEAPLYRNTSVKLLEAVDQERQGTTATALGQRAAAREQFCRQQQNGNPTQSCFPLKKSHFHYCSSSSHTRLLCFTVQAVHTLVLILQQVSHNKDSQFAFWNYDKSCQPHADCISIVRVGILQ